MGDTTDMVTVEFDGDTLIAVKRGDEILVVIKRMCESLGLDYADEVAKLRSCRWARVENLSIRDSAGRDRKTACIPLRGFPMWLATIETTKVSSKARAKLESYQNRAADVLDGLSIPSVSSLLGRLQGW